MLRGLQPHIIGGDLFREHVEALISYNLRNDSFQQDCIYIEQGHLMTPTSFMTHSMAIDLRRAVVVSWQRAVATDHPAHIFTHRTARLTHLSHSR